jgi:hypothetical protein
MAAERWALLPDELPTSTPPPAASPSDQPENDEQNDRTYGGVNNKGDDPRAKVNAQLRQQPISDERANDADYQVADEAVTTTPHDVPGEPPGHYADDEDDDETFVR